MAFFGPFLLILLWRGLKILREEKLVLLLLSLIGIIILLLMFLAGTYETGETARGCLYIYPFLIFPVGFYLKSINISDI